jgi:hypothetical protein
MSKAATSRVADVAAPAPGSLPERLVCGYLTALPLLWATGLLLPLATLLVIGLFVAVGRSRRSLAYAVPWFVVGTMQLVSVMVNMAAEGDPAWWLAKHLLASYVLGWFLFGGCIAIGASGAIRPEPFLRATARVGFYCVVAAVFLYPLSVVGGERFMLVLTPIGHLMPESLPSTSFFFGMLLYNWEELFGVLLPRLSFLFPWTTAMGFGGLCLVWVTANEPNRWRRRLAMASGVFMIVASMGRSAGAVFLGCVGLRVFLSCPRRWQIPLAAAGLAVALAVPIGSTIHYGDPLSATKALSEKFEDLRPSATRARDLVYDQSWAAVHKAPMLGYGWPGDPVYPEDYPQVMLGGGTMVPGSHSTYLGLLYLGGAMTLAAFLFAMTYTLGLVATSNGPPELVRNTFVLLVAMAVNGAREGLSRLVVTGVYALIWLGIALRGCRVTAAAPGTLRLRRPVAIRLPLTVASS